MAAERFSLKDHLFNPTKVAHLGQLLEDGIPGFDRSGFESAVIDQLPELELKQRIAMISSELEPRLDSDFEVAAQQISAALPPPLDPTLSDDDFGDFILAPFGKYVEDHGLDHLETSMSLLKELTKRFSMEGSVRPFINRNPDHVLELFAEWATDENYHVRRLVSESTRPTLPWAPRIALDIYAPLPLLDVLHADSTRYVTRSVANHLNDISKVDPDVMIDRLVKWREQGKQKDSELEWMSKHALRTLIKQGNPDAMEALGFTPDPPVSVELVHLSDQVVPGDFIEFEIMLQAQEDTRLILDYGIHFVKKNGERKPKVFKLKQLTLAAGETAKVNKRHRLKADATTFTLYPGEHLISVMANGTAVADGTFEVLES